MNVSNIELEFDNDELLILKNKSKMEYVFVNKHNNKMLVYSYLVYEIPSEEDLKELNISKENMELLKECELVVDNINTFIYKEIKTKVGTFYISNNSEREHFYCKLYDSNKEWVANITYKSTIDELKEIESIEDMVEIGICDNAIWSSTINDLFERYNFMMNVNYETYHKEEKLEMYETFMSYVNKVGSTYFVLDYDNF